MVDEPIRYERRDFDTRVVTYSAIGLVVICLLVAVAIWLLERGYDRAFAYRGTAAWISSPPMAPPAPQLQINSALDLAAMRAEEDSKLHSYGWVDRSAGVIRIPIDVAIQLTAERGLPVRPAAPSASPKPTP